MPECSERASNGGLPRLRRLITVPAPPVLLACVGNNGRRGLGIARIEAHGGRGILRRCCLIAADMVASSEVEAGDSIPRAVRQEPLRVTWPPDGATGPRLSSQRLARATRLGGPALRSLCVESRGDRRSRRLLPGRAASGRGRHSCPCRQARAAPPEAAEPPRNRHARSQDSVH